ncbi:MAG: hypothetical protein CL853_04735 [Crocinitomicaceae bacterium]|nr:hypothetical protein [Crocinitomicaceae bacterium]|tara:strand:+ start:6250 stop:6507 length:258 start_codon:yes stop_codon:yes gene_type:complete
MMKKILIAFGCMAFMSSCTLSHTISCTNNPVGSKVGMVKTKLFGDQDLSYETACKNGNITKVGTVETKMTNYLIFLQTKIVVTGE